MKTITRQSKCHLHEGEWCAEVGSPIYRRYIQAVEEAERAKVEAKKKSTNG